MIDLETYQQQLKDFESECIKHRIIPTQVNMVQIPYVDLKKFVYAINRAREIMETYPEDHEAIEWIGKYLTGKEKLQ